MPPRTPTGIFCGDQRSIAGGLTQSSVNLASYQASATLSRMFDILSLKSMAGKSPPSPVHTYHCLCTTLVLATARDLNSLPRRHEPVQDGALILAPPVDITRAETLETQRSEPASSVLLNVAPERKPVMIRREDGFEKRTLLKCVRCKLVIGYNLDEVHFEKPEGNPRPVYLLPGGLLSTQDMAEGKQPETPSWAEQK